MKHLLASDYRQRIGYPTLLLGVFALLASAAISFGDRLTRSEIAQRLGEDLQALLEQVVPPASHDNKLLEDTVTIQLPDERIIQAYRARRADRVTAVAYEMRGKGYGGSTLVLVMGIDREGRVLGVRVVSHAETPGLGDKLELAKSDWILSFDGRSLTDPEPGSWAVKKDGGVFDQFTGATITPRRVVGLVKDGLELFSTHRAELLEFEVGVGTQMDQHLAKQ